MKKILDYLKANKSVVIITAIVILLIVFVIIWSGRNDELSVESKTDKTGTEQKLERILSSIDGVGETDVMINEGENGIEGVVIVCRGANDIMIRNDILNAVSTALNIKKNIIAIYAMN